MEFDRVTTAVVFLAVIVLGVGALFGSPMAPRTIFMMVLPSMVIFGLITLAIGVKHGEYRASH